MRTPLAAALLALFIGCLAACGGGDDEAPPADAPAEQPKKTIDPPECAASQAQCTALSA